MLLEALVIMALNRRLPSFGLSLSWKIQLNCTMSEENELNTARVATYAQSTPAPCGLRARIRLAHSKKAAGRKPYCLFAISVCPKRSD